MTTAIYDVLLDDNGDLPISPRHVTGVRRLLQKVALTWKTHLGEWKKDTAVGMPYRLWIFELMEDVPAIGAVIRGAAEEIDGVIRIDDFAAVKTGEELTITGTIVVEPDERVDFTTTVGGAELGNFISIVHFHFAAGTITYG